MPSLPIVPWQLPEENEAPITERIEVEGIAIEIPILGSVSVDEARYLAWYNEQYGLANTALIPMTEAVYSLLLLRFGIAGWKGDKLVALKGSLPSLDEVMCYGTPRKMFPSALISQVFMFFMDEFSSNLGNDRTALAAEREGYRLQREGKNPPTGSASTGNSSSTTLTTLDSQAEPLDNAPSTSLGKPSRATKKNDSDALTTTVAA
jgi:hypothetical protein